MSPVLLRWCWRVGFHAAAGQAHAEVDALRRLAATGGSAVGKTLYVSLEPCNHVGRTGKCTEAILAAGIRRVVVGMGDPNPHVAGGWGRLSSQGRRRGPPRSLRGRVPSRKSWLSALAAQWSATADFESGGVSRWKTGSGECAGQCRWSTLADGASGSPAGSSAAGAV
jgi:tRNA(Arg) A34 adenosine deaminase TadA